MRKSWDAPEETEVQLKTRARATRRIRDWINRDHAKPFGGRCMGIVLYASGMVWYMI